MSAPPKKRVRDPDPIDSLTDEEVRILPPDYALKKIIGEEIDIRQMFSEANVEKAQAVIDQHRESFTEWVMKDVAQLEKSYAQAASKPAAAADEVRKLARAAFVIKSQAGTFGYDLATMVARSLDNFCNQDFQPCEGHMTIIRKHIDTLAVIFRKNITGDGGAVGKEVLESLDKLVARFKDK